MFRQAGADYFNPDEATTRILAANPDISTAEANSAAWHQGKRLLERAIAERLDFAFETTLGGHTISALLHEALAAGIEVRMCSSGLLNPTNHMRASDPGWLEADTTSRKERFGSATTGVGSI